MLNERSLLSQFLHFVAATVASLMVFSLYSIVDGLMVAKGVGEYAMAAVNLAVPFTNVLFSIGVIFAVGTSTIIAIYLGQNQGEKANSLFSQNIVLLTCVGLTITVLVFVFLEPFAVLLGAKGELLDYAVRYGKEKDRYYSYERFSQEIDAILQYLISHQIALEVNTAGLRMLGFTNPHPDVIRRYREMGGELITVGSDGHVPEYLGYGFDRLPELLSDCGFDSYTVFRKGKPEFRKVLVKI